MLKENNYSNQLENVIGIDKNSRKHMKLVLNMKKKTHLCVTFSNRGVKRVHKYKYYSIFVIA